MTRRRDTRVSRQAVLQAITEFYLVNSVHPVGPALAEFFDVSAPSIHHHVSALRESGELVPVDGDSRSGYEAWRPSDEVLARENGYQILGAESVRLEMVRGMGWRAHIEYRTPDGSLEQTVGPVKLTPNDAAFEAAAIIEQMQKERIK